VDQNELAVEGEGHWNGDPREYCGELRVYAGSMEDARNLARVYECLAGADPERLAALAEAAERITAGAERLQEAAP
jgi:hypothetical protein